MLNSLYFFFECFAFICCLFVYKSLDKNFKGFLPFLAFIVIYEFANIKDWMLWRHTNTWCNNFEGLIEVTFYSRFIASLDKRTSYRKKVTYLLLIVLIISFIDMLFIQGIFSGNTIAGVVQCSFLAILICIYYYNLINNSDEYLDLIHYPPFLATIGILFYTIATVFYQAAFSYMVYKNNYQFYIIYKVVTNGTCVILYSMLSAAFICQYRKTKQLLNV
jgi:hypothetical protein